MKQRQQQVQRREVQHLSKLQVSTITASHIQKMKIPKIDDISDIAIDEVDYSEGQAHGSGHYSLTDGLIQVVSFKIHIQEKTELVVGYEEFDDPSPSDQIKTNSLF